METHSTSPKVGHSQAEHELLSRDNARRLGRRARAAVMEHLGNQFGVEDKAVSMLCLTGMPLLAAGQALGPPFFEPHDAPAQITLEEFIPTAPKRRKLEASKPYGRVRVA